MESRRAQDKDESTGNRAESLTTIVGGWKNLCLTRIRWGTKLQEKRLSGGMNGGMLLRYGNNAGNERHDEKNQKGKRPSRC